MIWVNVKKISAMEMWENALKLISILKRRAGAALMALAMLSASSCTPSPALSDAVSAMKPAASVAKARRDRFLEPIEPCSLDQVRSVTVRNRDDTFAADDITVNNSDFTIPENVRQAILELYGRTPYDVGFYVIDLQSKMSFGYHADNSFLHASSIKLPYALYCFEELAKGNHTLDETVIYTEEDFVTGSGEIHFGSYGTAFTIEKLLYHMLYDSDNVAYSMLRRVFGIDGFNEMMERLGCTSRMEEKLWGYLTPHDLGLAWQELYTFYESGSEFGAMLWEFVTTNLFNDIATRFSEKNYPLIAHKSGWNQMVSVESGIVFADNRPYIMVVMTARANKLWPYWYTMDYIDAIMTHYHGEDYDYSVPDPENPADLAHPDP